MNEKINYKDVPKTFLYCNNKQCPRRNKCLRYQATLSIPQEIPYYTAVNPLHIAGNENKCDYNLQEATVAMTYAAGTGEYGPEASGKLAVGALAMGKVTETLGTCAVGLGWCPAGWIAGVGAAAAGL